MAASKIIIKFIVCCMIAVTLFTSCQRSQHLDNAYAEYYIAVSEMQELSGLISQTNRQLELVLNKLIATDYICYKGCSTLCREDQIIVQLTRKLILIQSNHVENYNDYLDSWLNAASRIEKYENQPRFPEEYHRGRVFTVLSLYCNEFIEMSAELVQAIDFYSEVVNQSKVGDICQQQ